KNNLTQTEIAEKFNTTRFKISKMLQEAIELKIVEITINHTDRRIPSLEKKIKSLFNLKQIIVLRTVHADTSDAEQIVAKSAAGFVESLLTQGSVVGLTWGATLYQTIQHINPPHRVPITIVQPFGTAGKRDVTIDTPDLIRRLAEKYDSRYLFLYAPLYIMSNQIRENLRLEPVINETMITLENIDVLLTGIGTPDSIFSTFLWKNYLSQDESLNNIAVGALYGRLFDQNGRILSTDVNDKVFGLDVSAIKKIKDRVAVVTNRFKAHAVIGALRGELINTLITDELTAVKIINLVDQLDNRSY
ncbi:MAG: sugar-binding domain-containing protein, partial [Sporolactobacillus sp.]